MLISSGRLKIASVISVGVTQDEVCVIAIREKAGTHTCPRRECSKPPHGSQAYLKTNKGT